MITIKIIFSATKGIWSKLLEMETDTTVENVIEGRSFEPIVFRNSCKLLYESNPLTLFQNGRRH